jgi:sporulation protein YtfJ
VGEHPIQGLMKTAMESIKGMVDVNTVVGEPVETHDGNVIIPVSRVSFGFAAGGGEYGLVHREGMAPGDFPFGGGSGAGVSVQPVGFLVVGQNQVRMLPVEGGQPMDRLIDVAPQLIEKLRGRAGGAEPAPGGAGGTDLGVAREVTESP